MHDHRGPGLGPQGRVQTQGPRGRVPEGLGSGPNPVTRDLLPSIAHIRTIFVHVQVDDVHVQVQVGDVHVQVQIGDVYVHVQSGALWSSGAMLQRL